MPTIFKSLIVVLHSKRFLITDINKEMISEYVILFCIFLLGDVKSSLLALMEDLLLKRLNSAHKLTDTELAR